MTREDFLGRVRSALHRNKGVPVENPPLLLMPLSDWDKDELVQQFKTEYEAVGGHVQVAADVNEAKTILKLIVDELVAETLICTNEAIVKEVSSGLGLSIAADPADADVGLSGARCALATTGSLVLTSEVGRKASLLPMNHVALLQAEHIVPTMAEALEHYLDELPSSWVQATGPSRTADIELTLTTGVHGPGVVHVILIRSG